MEIGDIFLFYTEIKALHSIQGDKGLVFNSNRLRGDNLN